MIIAAHRIKQPSEHKLNPRERTSQKGSAAHEKLIAGFLSGMNFTENDKVIIFQVSPGDVAELGYAGLDAMLTSSVPFLAYKGIYVQKASEYQANSPAKGTYDVDSGIVMTESLPMNQVFLGELMKRWWDSHPEAGPKEYAESAGDQKKPELRLCMWVEDTCA